MYSIHVYLIILCEYLPVYIPYTRFPRKMHIAKQFILPLIYHALCRDFYFLSCHAVQLPISINRFAT